MGPSGVEGVLTFQLARTKLTYHNVPLHPGTPDAAPEECHHQCSACTRPAADPGHFPAGMPQLLGQCAACLAFLQPQNVAHVMHVPVHVQQASDAVSRSGKLQNLTDQTSGATFARRSRRLPC